MKHALLSFFLLMITGGIQAAAPAVLKMQTDPDTMNVHPQHDTLDFRISVHQSNGTPIPRARLHVQLQAPDTPWLASTDFPVVEGTSLLDTDVQLDQGEYKFRYVPPIRGVYTLKASVTPLPGDTSFAPAEQQWQTEITENPDKKRNLALLLFILVVVGSVTGYVLGRSPVPSTLILLVLVCWQAVPLKAHGPDHGPAHASKPASQTSIPGESGSLDVQLLTEQPRVGELSSLNARYIDTQGRQQPARFRLQVVQLEHGTEVFSTEMIAPDGFVQWQGQFYDGSEHRITVEAIPLASSWSEGKSANAQLDVSVASVSPPTRSVLKSFGFLTAWTTLALILGLVVGRFFARKERGLI